MLDAALNETEARSMFMDVWWIRTSQKLMWCTCCGMRERIPVRIGPVFFRQSHRFYARHGYCTHPDPKFRINFHETVIAYDQGVIRRGFQARRHISARPIPEFVHVNTKELRCSECGQTDNILGLNRDERDIRLWEFIQLHSFCKNQRRTGRGEIL